MRAFRVLPPALLLLCLSPFAVTHAQEPVKWTVRTSKPVTRQDDNVAVSISAEIASGWHIYSLTQGSGGPSPTRIRINGSIFKLVGKINAPEPRVQVDPNFSVKTEILEGNPTFKLVVLATRDAAPGTRVLEIGVHYQACNDSVCMPPRTVQLSSPLEILQNVTSPKTTLQKSEPSNKTEEPLRTPTPASALSSPTSGVNTESSTKDQSVSNSPNGTTDVDQQSVAARTAINTGPHGAGSFWSFIWLATTFGALSL